LPRLVARSFFLDRNSKDALPIPGGIGRAGQVAEGVVRGVAQQKRGLSRFPRAPAKPITARGCKPVKDRQSRPPRGGASKAMRPLRA
jgi:hypothetical protein